jgi:hypothetical protein
VVNEASEEPPTQRVYLPGSATHRPSAFQTASWSSGIWKTTILVSCGVNVTWRTHTIATLIAIATLCRTPNAAL